MTERLSFEHIIEVRDSADGTGNTVVGYAAVFNSLSQDLGGFVERVAPGAFAKTIQEADIRALWNHDSSVVLGRNAAGTLRLSEDAFGLRFEIDLPNTQMARDLAESMRRGDINQTSFGFRVIRDSWDVTDNNYPLRTLEEVALLEVSPVTFPAYLASSSSLRSLAKQTGVDEGTLAEAAKCGELRDYISGGTADAVVTDETDEVRGDESGAETAVVADATQADTPGNAHLSVDDVRKRLTDAAEQDLAQRVRFSAGK